jgi:hypothetical protein
MKHPPVENSIRILWEDTVVVGINEFNLFPKLPFELRRQIVSDSSLAFSPFSHCYGDPAFSFISAKMLN